MSFALEGVLKLDSRGWVRGAREAQAATETIGDGFGKLPEEAAKAGKLSGGKLTDALAKGFKGDDIGDALGGKLLAGLTASGLVAGIGALLQQGFAQLGSLNTLQAQFRLTADEAARAGKIAGELYRDNWGESLQQLQTNVAYVSRQLGDVSDEELTRITTKVQATSDTWGIEFADLTRSASQMVENGIVKSYDEALDVIVAGFQDGANEAGDFLDTIDEYSQHFAAMGLSGADALAIIEHGLQNGQRDSDKLADAVKEMRIRVVENTDAITVAYGRLGLNADEMRGKFAQGGAAGRQAYLDVLTALRDIEDPTERQALAVQFIGTQYEDLGPKALDSLLAISGATQDVTGRSEELADTIKATEWDQFSRTMSDAANRAAESFASFANDSLQWIASWSNAHETNVQMISDFDAAETAARDFDQTLLAGVTTFDGAKQAALDYLQSIGFVGDEQHAANLIAIEWNDTTTAAALAAETAARSEYQRARETAAAADATDDSTDATVDYADALAELVDATEDQIKSQRDYIESLRDVADASQTVERRSTDLADEIAAANDAVAKGTYDAEGLQRAQRQLSDQTVALADAHVKLAVDTARANGQTLSAAQSLDVWNSSALSQAATIAGPLRAELVNYIAQVNGIPEAAVTEISALLDQGKIDEANGRLAQLSTARAVALNVDVNTGVADDALAKIVRTWDGKVIRLAVSAPSDIIIGGRRTYAGGTPYHPGGLATVGEYGREVVALPRGARVFDAATSRGMLSQPAAPIASSPITSRSSWSSSTTVAVTVNAGLGTDGYQVGRQIAEILSSYRQAGGPLPFAS